ncbi:MAG: tetratricopeptide repeat protein [Spirochaetales bacterium]|nr:tetratricopeptide repeat protein [Spirochaetales bacterium]
MKRFPLLLILFLLAAGLSAQSKEQLFDQGLGAFQDKLYEEALANFQDYLKRYANESRADAVLYMSGVAQYSLGRFGESLMTFDRLKSEKETSPYLRRTPYWLGLNYFKGEEWDASEEAFSEQLRYSGETYYVERSFLYLGLLNEKKAHWEGAAEHYARLISLSGNTELVTQAYYRRGLAYLNLADYERALPNFEKLSADYGSSPYTKAMPYYIGLCYLNLGQPEEAVRRFDLYLTLFPKGEYREEVLFLLIRAEGERGNGERALELIEDLEGQADLSFRARQMKAENFSTLGETEKARQVWLELLEEEERPQEKDRIKYNIGLSWLKEGERERAIPWFKETLALLESPVRRDSLDALAALYLEADEKELALGYGKTLFDDYPDYVKREETGAMAAALMMELNRNDMVEAHLKIMVELYGESEKNDLYLMMLGQAAMDREEWTRALTYLGRLESNYPQSEYREEALYRLGYIYILREEYIRGAEFFKELLALDKELTSQVEEDSRYSLALAYYKGGAGNKALTYFEEYLEKYGNNEKAGEIALYMGNIHFENRNWAFAAEYYGRAVTLLKESEENILREAAFKEALSLQKNQEWARSGDLFHNLYLSGPALLYGYESLYQEGICRIEEERWTDARKIFEEAVIQTYGEVRERSLYQLARIALWEENRKEAIDLARLIKSDYPESDLGIHLFFSEAEDYWALREFDKARTWYLLCLEVFPEQAREVQASLRASLALAEGGDPDSAIEELYSGLLNDLSGSAGQGLYSRATALGRLLVEGGSSDRAETYLLELKEKTDDLSLLAPLIIAAERTGSGDVDRSASLEALYRAEELPFSMRTEALLLLGDYRIDRGEEEEAKALYRVVMDSNKGELGAEANYLLGELLVLENPSEGAQELLNVSYNYPEQELWAARALYRSWEIYSTQEEGERKREIVKEKLLDLYPQSEWAALLK